MYRNHIRTHFTWRTNPAESANNNVFHTFCEHPGKHWKMSLVYNRLFLFFIFYGRFSFSVRREKREIYAIVAIKNCRCLKSKYYCATILIECITTALHLFSLICSKSKLGLLCTCLLHHRRY